MKTSSILSLLTFIALAAAKSWAQTPAPAPDAPPAPIPAEPPAPAATPAGPSTAPLTSAPGAESPAAEEVKMRPPAGPGDRILPVFQPPANYVPTISGALDVANVSAAIREQPIDNRDKLLQELSALVETAVKGVDELKSRQSNLDESQKQALAVALQDFEKRRTDLDAQMNAARRANGEKWLQDRAMLAAEYAFFTSAIAAVELAVP